MGFFPNVSDILPAHITCNGALVFNFACLPTPPTMSALIYLCLSLTSIFGTLGACFGLNALIKSNREKGYLKANAPKGVSVNINTDDVLFSGIVVAVISGAVAVVALTSLQLMVLPGWRRWADKTKKLRGGLMLFFTVWLLAAHIPFTIFFATKKAGVRAWGPAATGAKELPHAVVVAAAKKLGSTDIYKDVHYREFLKRYIFIFLC